MACNICGRSSCTESFHSIDEQVLYNEIMDKAVDKIKPSLIRKIDFIKGHYHGDNYYIKFTDVIEIINNI